MIVTLTIYPYSRLDGNMLKAGGSGEHPGLNQLHLKCKGFMTCQEATITVECPRCGSDALYKYGKTSQGRQRFRCLICGRQFVAGKSRDEMVERPVCPVCGRRMHIYRQERDFVRFRCSGYPKCRSFLKAER